MQDITHEIAKKKKRSICAVPITIKEKSVRRWKINSREAIILKQISIYDKKCFFQRPHSELKNGK